MCCKQLQTHIHIYVCDVCSSTHTLFNGSPIVRTCSICGLCTAQLYTMYIYVIRTGGALAYVYHANEGENKTLSRSLSNEESVD